MENLLILVNILAVILIIVILLGSEGGALGLGVSQDNFTSARSVDFFNKIYINYCCFVHYL